MLADNEQGPCPLKHMTSLPVSGFPLHGLSLKPHSVHKDGNRAPFWLGVTWALFHVPLDPSAEPSGSVRLQSGECLTT